MIYSPTVVRREYAGMPPDNEREEPPEGPDKAPETPTDEPRPTPVQDPPAEPGRSPYVVISRLPVGATVGTDRVRVQS